MLKMSPCALERVEAEVSKRAGWGRERKREGV